MERWLGELCELELKLLLFIFDSQVLFSLKWLDGCWFYRPEETYHLATKKFYEKVGWRQVTWKPRLTPPLVPSPPLFLLSPPPFSPLLSSFSPLPSPLLSSPLPPLPFSPPPFSPYRRYSRVTSMAWCSSQTCMESVISCSSETTPNTNLRYKTSILSCTSIISACILQ